MILPQTQAEQRLAVCCVCDERRELPAHVIQCKQCGCVMNMKVLIPRWSCPLGKW